MFEKILVPVDLEHADKLEKALSIAAGLAKAHDVSLHVVGITGTAPGPSGHTPEEYAARLAEFAERTGAGLGVDITPHSVAVADPTADTDATILKKAEELGTDLLVMATRVPGFAERIFSSHGNYVASHATMSVFLVR